MVEPDQLWHAFDQVLSLSREQFLSALSAVQPGLLAADAPPQSHRGWLYLAPR